MSDSRPRLHGCLKVPGDKSISHRALIFAALCEGKSKIYNLSPAADCLSTADCLEQLGLKIASAGQPGENGNQKFTTVFSPGLANLNCPRKGLFAGNSGTTIRLLCGLLAGQSFTTHLDGDDSLRARPMSRVLDPLKQMGARVIYQAADGFAPFSITGGALTGFTYNLKVASAQVQTALLLAGLQAQGETKVEMPGSARDHTLRQFQQIGVPFSFTSPGTVSVQQLPKPLAPFVLEVPADMSSAAFFMVAAACLPGSKVSLANLGINPGRRLVIDVLQSMGAAICLGNERTVSGEPVADISISYAERLSGATISGAQIAAGVDEIPILALAGALCDGKFSVSGASELRVKESDRLKAIVSNLKASGADIKEFPDGFEIKGKPELKGGCIWQSHGDHRLAMTGLIAALLSTEPVTVDDTSCAAISYPSFETDLAGLLS